MKTKYLTTENMKEIVNFGPEDEVTCYHYESRKCSIHDVEEAREFQRKEEAIILPTEEELFPWNKALNNFAQKHNIFIPKQCSVWNYLCKNDWKYEFYDYLGRVRLKALKVWLCERGIKYMQIC